MARLPALISAADLAAFEAMLNDYRAGRLTNRPEHDPTRRPPAPGTRRKRGVLLSAITGPDCLTDEPPAALMAVYKPDGTGALVDTGEQIPLVIYDPDLEAPIGAYCRAEWIDGAWEPYWVGCSDALADCGGI